MMQTDIALYLGPATVSRRQARRVLVQRAGGDEEEWAELALATPYEPGPGDRVLLVAQEDRSYVIGLLEGHGAAALCFPGDVLVAAPKGRITLAAGKGIVVSTPAVAVRAESVEVQAKTLHQRLEVAFHWVKELFQMRAGRSRVVVDGSSYHVAQRTTVRSEKETKIDGERVYLG